MKQFWLKTGFWKWATILIFLIGWSYVNYRLKISFLTIIAVVFFVFLWVTSRPKVLIVAIPVLLIILVFTQTPLTWVNLKTENQNLAEDFQAYLTQFLTPNSGKEILPDKVLQIHELIKKHEVKDYRFTETISEDALIHQRTIESTWPITENPDSDYLIGFIGDIAHYGGCYIIDQTQDIELGTCQ